MTHTINSRISELQKAYVSNDPDVQALLKARYSDYILQSARDLSHTVVANQKTNFGIREDQFKKAGENALLRIVSSWDAAKFLKLCESYCNHSKRLDLQEVYDANIDQKMDDFIKSQLLKAMKKPILHRHKIVKSWLSDIFSDVSPDKASFELKPSPVIVLALKKSFQTLPEVEKEVLQALCSKDLSRKSIGESLQHNASKKSVTNSHVGRIEKQALGRLCSRESLPKLLNEYFSTFEL